MLNERVYHAGHSFRVFFDYAARSFGGLLEYAAHLAVDIRGHGLGILALMPPFAANEYLGVARQEHGADLFAHAELRHHAAGKLGSALQIVGGAGGNIGKPYLFGHAAAHEARDLVKHLTAGKARAVVGGDIAGVAQRPAALYDRKLVDGIAVGQLPHHYRMADLMSGGIELVFGRDHAALLFGAPGNALHRLGDEIGIYHFELAAGGKDRRLVQYVFKIRARHAGGELRDLVKIHVLRHGLVLGVKAEYRLAALNIGIIDRNLPVEPAGTQQSGIQYVGAVGCGNDDNALVALKAVHFDEELIEGLLLFIMTAAEARAALPADSVDLVDENEGGSELFRGVEEIAHAACAHANEHFNEIGAADGEERDVRFPRDGLCEQGLARAGRAYEQHALGYARAHIGEGLGILQEIDHFGKLFLFFLAALNVLKGLAAILAVRKPCAALAEVHRLTVIAPARPHDEQHTADEHRAHYNVGHYEPEP